MPYDEQPGATFVATPPQMESGLVGKLTVKVVSEGGTEVVPATTSGINEAPPNSGNYATTLVAPAVPSPYYIVWEGGAEAPQAYAIEDLVVLGTPPNPLPPPGEVTTYATVADYQAFDPNFQVDDANALAQVLIDASHDVDSILGPIFMAVAVHSQLEPPPGIGNLKYDPSRLLPYHANKLRRAACAQAEYRMAMGPDFFVQAQVDASGPLGFSIKGNRPYIGPKVRRELAGSGLIHATGRAVA